MISKTLINIWQNNKSSAQLLYQYHTFDKTFVVNFQRHYNQTTTIIDLQKQLFPSL